MAAVKAGIPGERDQEMNEGIARPVDGGRVEKHEIDVRGGIQLATPIPPQGHQGTGEIDLRSLAADLFAPPVELLDYYVREVCQLFDHLDAARALAVLLQNALPLALHEAPEQPQELLPLPRPVPPPGEEPGQLGGGEGTIPGS